MNIILDFDSTIISLEGLDELTRLVATKEKRPELFAQVEAITNQGMAGEIGFAESLEKRVGLLDFDRSLLSELIPILNNSISAGFFSVVEGLSAKGADIYVISGGFLDFIRPVIASSVIEPDNVFANEFVFSESGKLVGVNRDNLLAHDNGKVEVVRSLNLTGITTVIGDGFTDCKIKQAGLADKFLAFTQHSRRENVVAAADGEVRGFEEVSPIILQT